jgi:hypothetical protein
MDGTYNWEVFHQEDRSTVLVDRHLNFDIRYDVNEEMIVTGKKFRFHLEQIHPCVSLCLDGKYEHTLCQLKDTKAKSATDALKCLKDPIIGNLVKISHYNEISFKDQDGDANSLDLSWRHLRNIAWPIVDSQLARLAISGVWKMCRVRLNLGTLMINNTMVQIDNESYAGMKKDKTSNGLADMEACNKPWNKKLASIVMKRDIERERQGNFPKHRKT